MDYVIAGATGLVGSEVLRLLRNDSANRIFCVGRRASELTGENVIFVPWDFTGEINWPQEAPQEPHAICTLGTTIKKAGSQQEFRRVDYDFVLQFARAMLRQKAQSLHVVTSHGASPDSLIFYNRVKGEVERDLSALGLPVLHIYRPSLLLGHRREQRTGESAAAAVAKFLSPLFHLPGLNNVQPTPAERLAQVIVQNCATGPGRGGVHIHSNYEILHGRQAERSM